MGFVHFLRCRTLFPDKQKKVSQLPGDPRWATSENPPLKVTKALLKDSWIPSLLKDHPKYKSTADLAKAVTQGDEKKLCYSKLSLTKLWKAYCKLRKHHPEQKTVVDSLPLPDQSVVLSSSTPVQSLEGKRARNESTIMTLYLHHIVIHMPALYEVIDFKNTNTERAEGFLERLNRILQRFTNRDLETDQPFREVIVRHHFKETVLEEANVTSPTTPSARSLYLSTTQIRKMLRSFLRTFKNMDTQKDWIGF
jgi:hypothetical protein